MRPRTCSSYSSRPDQPVAKGAVEVPATGRATSGLMSSLDGPTGVAPPPAVSEVTANRMGRMEPVVVAGAVPTARSDRWMPPG